MNNIDNMVTVYFSKNRPLQLSLTLTTNRLVSSDWEGQHEVVLYCAENDRYQKMYDKLENKYSRVSFIKETSFKDNLLSIIADYEYVMFVVDDTIFTHEYSLAEIRQILEDNKDLIGFSLRLGENTKRCYSTGKPNEMPMFTRIRGDFYKSNWTVCGEGDFSYPLELSSSVYRISDIKEILLQCEYRNPNSLEWDMYLNTNCFDNLSFIAHYNISRAFSNPVNKVQETNSNRCGHFVGYTPASLLACIETGGQINPAPFYHFVSNGAHQEVEFKFVWR